MGYSRLLRDPGSKFVLDPNLILGLQPCLGSCCFKEGKRHVAHFDILGTMRVGLSHEATCVCEGRERAIALPCSLASVLYLPMVHSHLQTSFPKVHSV